MDKRKSGRAIVIFDEQIVSMYREREGRVFYTFPGGGMEAGESEEQCVKREVLEEFGIVVEPIKKVYTYESERSIEYFYVCKWVSGELGTGQGEEFQAGRNNGVYKPTAIKIADIPNLPLMPPEVAEAFYKDYRKNGQEVRKAAKKINGTIRR